MVAWTKVGNSRGGERSGQILGVLPPYPPQAETMGFTEQLGV